MSGQARDLLQHRAVPVMAGGLFILLFLRLGFWQLDRAAEKNALALAFEKSDQVALVTAALAPEEYQAIRAEGRYLDARQVLIDNAIVNSRLGYFVITPLEFEADGPLLLVNRGWVPKNPAGTGLPDVSLATVDAVVEGKTGWLPRVGIRPGEAFVDKISWPRLGVWPTYAEVAAELGRDVLPYVLMLGPEQPDGYLRQWQPRESGTSTHYGYAFQWFAMATAVAGLMAWHLRRKRKNNGN